MTEQNPLQQYFRSEKTWVTLPSGTSYYNADLVAFNDSGEVGIKPMTATDEILAKNPDALLNGDAISNIIKSCVPAISNPKQLITNDIDALMLAIRHATYGDNIELETKCPVCEHSNTFEISVSNSLGHMGKLESEYKIDMEGGVSVYVRPFTYTQTISALKLQFEQYKAAQTFTAQGLSEEKKLQMFSDSYNKMAATSLSLLSGCIYKIIANEMEVTDSEHIAEFMANIGKATFKDIEDLVATINDIGILKKLTAVCQNEECKHEWQASIDFNPVTFFTES